MFTGVRDPGHQRAQCYNYALCGPNHSSYSTGPGKVINDGECSYRESQMVATWRPPSKKKSLLWPFWPEEGHQPNRASGVASDQTRERLALL